MPEVNTDPRLEYDLAREALYHEKKIPGRGEKFIAEVELAEMKLRRFPEICAWVHKPYRQYILKDFNCSLIYRYKPEDDEIYIVALHGHAQHPDQWKDRI